MGATLEKFFLFLITLRKQLKKEVPYLGEKFYNIIEEIKELAMDSDSSDLILESFNKATRNYEYNAFLESNIIPIMNLAKNYNPYIPDDELEKFVVNDDILEKAKSANAEVYQIYKEQLEFIRQRFENRTSLQEILPIDREVLKDFLKDKPEYFDTIEHVFLSDKHNNFYTYRGKKFIRLTLEPYRLKVVIDLKTYNLFIANIYQRKNISSWINYFDIEPKRKIYAEVIGAAIKDVYYHNKHTRLVNGSVEFKPLVKKNLKDIISTDKQDLDIMKSLIDSIVPRVVEYEHNTIFDPVSEQLTFYLFINERGHFCKYNEKPIRLLTFRYKYINGLKYENKEIFNTFMDKAVVIRHRRYYKAAEFFSHLNEHTIENIIYKSHK